MGLFRWLILLRHREERANDAIQGHRPRAPDCRSLRPLLMNFGFPSFAPARPTRSKVTRSSWRWHDLGHACDQHHKVRVLSSSLTQFALAALLMLPLRALAGDRRAFGEPRALPGPCEIAVQGHRGRGARQRRDQKPGAEDWRACVAEILEAEARYGIPENYLRHRPDRSRADGPRWIRRPLALTVNVEGEGRFFADRAKPSPGFGEAAAGKHVDRHRLHAVNLRWHPKPSGTWRKAFRRAPTSPMRHATLVSLRQRRDPGEEAIGRYHSYAEPERAYSSGSRITGATSRP